MVMTIKIKFILPSLIIISSLSTNAQLSSFDFNNDTKVKFSVRYGAIQTTGVSKDSVNDVNGILIRPLELDRISPDVGGYNTSHRWAFIFETFTLAVIDALDGGDFDWGQKTTSTYIGDFILGWHNHTWNVVYTDNIALSAGLHWGDYFLGYEPYNRTYNNYGTAREPAGWYGALGPATMLDVNLANTAVLHLEGAYAFSKKINDFPDMIKSGSYPSPGFLNITAQVRSNSFIYGGMEYVRSLNNGSNNFNASRMDIFLGVWF